MCGVLLHIMHVRYVHAPVRVLYFAYVGMLYRLITEPGTYKLVQNPPFHTPQGIAARSVAGRVI